MSRELRGWSDTPGMTVIGSNSSIRAVSDLMTPGEVAEALRISRRHVRRLAADGRLQRIQLGYRTVRYSAANVEALVTPRMSEAEGGNPRLRDDHADTGGGRDSG